MAEFPRLRLDARQLVDRVEQRSAGAVQLAVHVCMATRVERRLLRAVRLHVLPHLGAGDEADLWTSELAEIRGIDGLLLRSDVGRVLRERAGAMLRAGGGQSSSIRAAWREVRTHHAGSPPLVRMEEQIAWLAISESVPEPKIDRQLSMAVAALVRDGRTGVARWAERALPRLPEAALNTDSAWMLAQTAGGHLHRDAATLAAPFAHRTTTFSAVAAVAEVMPQIPLGVRRIGDRLELGAVGVGGVAIMVPSTEPRVVRLRSSTRRSGGREISITTGTRADVSVGWSVAVLESGTGQLWEIPVLTDAEQELLDRASIVLDVHDRATPRVLATVIGPLTLVTVEPAHDETTDAGGSEPMPWLDGNGLAIDAISDMGGRTFVRLRDSLPDAPEFDRDAVPADGARVVSIGLGPTGQVIPVVGTWRLDPTHGPMVVARGAVVPAAACLGAPIVIDLRLVGFVAHAHRDEGDLVLHVNSPPDLDPASASGPSDSVEQSGLTVELLPAGQGTSILVGWGSPRDRRYLLDDGGPLKTSSAILAAVIAQTGGRLQLVIASHSDADRIQGLSAVIDAGVEVDDIWFNGPAQVDRALAAVPVGTVALQLFVERLTSLPANGAFEGGLVVIPDEGRLPVIALGGGATVTLLGPTRAQLDRLAQAWRRSAAEYLPPNVPGVVGDPPFSAEAGVEPDADAEPDAEPTEPDDASQGAARPRQLGSDRAVANGSSIAALVECDGASVLLPGDSHAAPLLDAIHRLLIERQAYQLYVDVFVLPRGGSAGNVTAELLREVNARTYAICTDGQTYGLPHAETIETLAAVSKDPVTIAFNYHSPTTEVWSDPAVQARLGLNTIYPDGEAGLVLTTAPRAGTGASTSA